MTTLIFVRHGQSESNLAKVFTGQGNTKLTPLGRAQAERTAEYLRDFPISRIYASDLDRAMETASPTAKFFGLEVVPNAIRFAVPKSAVYLPGEAHVPNYAEEKETANAL